MYWKKLITKYDFYIQLHKKIKPQFEKDEPNVKGLGLYSSSSSSSSNFIPNRTQTMKDRTIE